jgi:hypothetical protein
VKHLVWLKETADARWETNGDGPLSKKTADRIAREIRPLTAAARVLPVGTEPLTTRRK